MVHLWSLSQFSEFVFSYIKLYPPSLYFILALVCRGGGKERERGRKKKKRREKGGECCVKWESEWVVGDEGGIHLYLLCPSGGRIFLSHQIAVVPASECSCSRGKTGGPLQKRCS